MAVITETVEQLDDSQKLTAPNCQRSPEFARLRTLWRLMQDYVEDITRWKNRLEQALESGQIKHICQAPIL